MWLFENHYVTVLLDIIIIIVINIVIVVVVVVIASVVFGGVFIARAAGGLRLPCLPSSPFPASWG